jgi:hypothetical protein
MGRFHHPERFHHAGGGTNLKYVSKGFGFGQGHGGLLDRDSADALSGRNFTSGGYQLSRGDHGFQIHLLGGLQTVTRIRKKDSFARKNQEQSITPRESGQIANVVKVRDQERVHRICGQKGVQPVNYCHGIITDQ